MFFKTLLIFVLKKCFAAFCHLHFERASAYLERMTTNLESPGTKKEILIFQVQEAQQILGNLPEYMYQLLYCNLEKSMV